MRKNIRQGQKKKKGMIFMNKKLICYFSATGTTKRVSEKISQIIGGDLFSIEPVSPYTSDDLDWTNKNSRTSLEVANDNVVEIKKGVENIDDYQKIILGFPVWWYKEPRIIDCFLDENQLEGKNIYVFVTSGGSTVTDSLENLREKYPNLRFVSGKRLDLSIKDEEILDWIGA